MHISTEQTKYTELTHTKCIMNFKKMRHNFFFFRIENAFYRIQYNTSSSIGNSIYYLNVLRH